MISNYFKIAWRNILKRQYYSVLNIAGLAIGIVFIMLIAAFTWSEMRINKNLRNAKNQYFLTSSWKNLNQVEGITTVGPLAKRLRENYPAHGEFVDW